MFKIKAKATGDAQKRLERLLTGLGAKRGAMMGKIAKRLEVDLREKFVSNGGRTFWQDASNSIYKAHTEDSASVVVKKVGVALQYFGGTVRPKNGRNLAIPLRPEFYGRNPREMTAKRLFVFGQRKAAGKRFLAYQDGVAVRVAYLLTPKAVIKPHPEKFPTDAEIYDGANEVINLYVNKCYGLHI